MVLNLHLILHLGQYVREHDPLDAFGALPFGSHFHLKKMAANRHLPHAQVERRVIESDKRQSSNVQTCIPTKTITVSPGNSCYKLQHFIFKLASHLISHMSLTY